MLSTDIASDRLGRYMLKGYTLLQEQCDTCHTPLLRKNGELLCCICIDPPKQEQKDDTDEMEWNESEWKKKEEKRSMISKELGHYLLSGWMMTDLVCDQCYEVPLMKKNDVLKCVYCPPVSVVQEQAVVEPLVPESVIQPNRETAIQSSTEYPREPVKESVKVSEDVDILTFAKSSLKAKIHELTVLMNKTQDPRDLISVLSALELAIRAFQQ
ncbi:hypothetical protein EDD86DRAFT_243719 [Gorgonomyces haynaldii]|nr:hypothetical protein EDD86DRAFT_243719 [Gorgonomyces haynaldii]